MKQSRSSSGITTQAVSQLAKDFAENCLRKLKLDRRIKPWMRGKEMAIFREVIENHQPLRCLEWGAGLSTLYFPKLLPPSAQWYAIEHNAGWATRLQSMNQSETIEIYEVAPNCETWQGDGTYDEFKDYLEFPRRFAPFDLIIVDGRARKDCLKVGAHLLSDRGVVILHDANRTKYHDGFQHYQEHLLFSDYHQGNGGVWIGSHHVPIKSIIDLERNQRIWKKHEQLVGYFR